MTDEGLKAAIDLFLKKVNATAQSEIRKVARAALASGRIRSPETVTAAVKLSSEKLGLNVTIYSKIEL